MASEQALRALLRIVRKSKDTVNVAVILTALCNAKAQRAVSGGQYSLARDFGRFIITDVLEALCRNSENAGREGKKEGEAGEEGDHREKGD